MVSEAFSFYTLRPLQIVYKLCAKIVISSWTVVFFTISNKCHKTNSAYQCLQLSSFLDCANKETSFKKIIVDRDTMDERDPNKRQKATCWTKNNHRIQQVQNTMIPINNLKHLHMPTKNHWLYLRWRSFVLPHTKRWWPFG